MVGATVGAGVGRYQGVNGLIIDSLLSVRLVTAEGQLVDVSADSNPDLFWAVRGAAANFGIITSATYQLHPQINNGQVLNADFILPASSNGSYFDLLQSLQDTIPAELATISIVAYSDALNEVSPYLPFAAIADVLRVLTIAIGANFSELGIHRPGGQGSRAHRASFRPKSSC